MIEPTMIDKLINAIPYTIVLWVLLSIGLTIWGWIVWTSMNWEIIKNGKEK